MKCFVGLLAVFFAFNPNPQRGDLASLISVVETERAFSKASEEKGTRESFFEYIAEDGILFRPTAVNGKRWMRQNPLPPSTKRSLLIWTPVYADISQAGDLAYTTGPWEFKQDSKDTRPAAFGNFITVWKKQPNGQWRFVVDLGISNPQPIDRPTPWQPPEEIKQGLVKSAAEVHAAKAALIKRDWEFSNEAEAKGALKAFVGYSAEDVRVFRENSHPFIGRKSLKQAFSKPDSWTSQPDFADVSNSGDLAYTYGIYQFRANDAAKTVTEKGNYLRIWKLQNGEWRIVVDVSNPVPQDEKKT
jgi:ketosteroid isomerase-like protein